MRLDIFIATVAVLAPFVLLVIMALLEVTTIGVIVSLLVAVMIIDIFWWKR